MHKKTNSYNKHKKYVWQSKSRINILSMILQRLKEQCHEDFGKAMTKISNEFYHRPGLTIINFLKIF